MLLYHITKQEMKYLFDIELKDTTGDVVETKQDLTSTQLQDYMDSVGDEEVIEPSEVAEYYSDDSGYYETNGRFVDIGLGNSIMIEQHHDHDLDEYETEQFYTPSTFDR